MSSKEDRDVLPVSFFLPIFSVVPSAGRGLVYGSIEILYLSKPARKKQGNNVNEDATTTKFMHGVQRSQHNPPSQKKNILRLDPIDTRVHALSEYNRVLKSRIILLASAGLLRNAGESQDVGPQH